MKKVVSLVLSVAMLLSLFAFADVEMSELGVLPYVTEPVTLNIAIRQHPFVLNYDDNYMTKLCEEETGLDIEFRLLPTAETNTVVDLMMASGEKLPDVIIVEGLGGRIANYAAEGFIIPLNDYFDKENGLAYYFWNEATHMSQADYDEYFQGVTEADGNIYSWAYFTRGLGDRQRITPYINMYFLKNLGMEKPTTRDEFYEYLKAVKDNDANGNGDPNDEIPLIGGTWNGGDDEMIINMFTYYNPDYKLNVENDKVYAPFVTDEWREAMIFMNKLVSEGLLSDLTFSITTDELVSMIQGFGPEEQIIGYLVGTFTTSAPDGTNPCILAYDAIGPVEDAYTPLRTANVSKLGFISADCETPELAFRFFDYWANEKRSLITRYGEPGVSWYWRDDDPEFFDSYYVGPNQNCKKQGWEAKVGMVTGVVNPWVTENNEIWCYILGMLPAQSYGQWATVDAVEANSWEESVEIGLPSVHRTYTGATDNALWYGKVPEQVFTNPVYTLEENDKYNDTINTVKSYVNECIASFALGQLDPNSDADWETYKSNLETAGLQQWLDLAQTYWDRSH